MSRRVLVARYRAREGEGDNVASALTAMAAEVKSNEPGCTDYRAGRSVENPDEFILYEEYVDQAALEAHRETAHFLAIVEAEIVPLLEERQRFVLEPLPPAA
jgi:quinol monooxygenase YgiN